MACALLTRQEQMYDSCPKQIHIVAGRSSSRLGLQHILQLSSLQLKERYGRRRAHSVPTSKKGQPVMEQHHSYKDKNDLSLIHI